MTVDVKSCYPEFVPGQAVTHDELNDIRLRAESRADVLGRSIGFGVACGLRGQVTAAGLFSLTVGWGFNSEGHVLALSETHEIILHRCGHGLRLEV